MQLLDAPPSLTETASGSEVRPSAVDAQVQHLMLQLQQEIMQQGARTHSIARQTLACVQQQMLQQQQTESNVAQHMADMQRLLQQLQLRLQQQLQLQQQQQQQAPLQPDQQPLQAAQRTVSSYAVQSAPGGPQLFRASHLPAELDSDSGGACISADAAQSMNLQSNHANARQFSCICLLEPLCHP